MTEVNGQTTTDSKEVFDRLAHSYNVKILHYHADNGLFDTAKFKTCIKDSNQTLLFWGVNARHQNGKAKRRIGGINTGTRVSLLHASHHWSNTINASLWKNAMKNYINLRNNIPTQYLTGAEVGCKKLLDTFPASPSSKLCGFETNSDLKDFYPFGSPVYFIEKNFRLNSIILSGSIDHE